MFEGFVERDVEGIHLVTAGDGPPVLLLHGYPQSHVMWHRVAPGLAEAGHRVVCPDLRGYGASHAPPAGEKASNYSKRAVAAELVDVMVRLGHDRFAVVGHDRGGRVAYRLALDHPDRVTRLATLDIVPTIEQWEQMSGTAGVFGFHWQFLAQPHPFPERFIGADPEYWLRTLCGRWAGDPAALEEGMGAYVAAFDEETIRRQLRRLPGGRGGRRALDAEDREAGRRIACPVLACGATGPAGARRWLTCGGAGPMTCRVGRCHAGTSCPRRRRRRRWTRCAGSWVPADVDHFDHLVVGGARLEVRRLAGAAGELPTLVFLHEGLGCVALWRDFPEQACAAAGGLAGFVYSRRGYGGSDPRPLPWPLDYMEQEAAALPAVLTAAGIGRAVLVGHSDGATIALLAAAARMGRSEIVGVVALAPHVTVEEQNLAAIREIGERYATTDLRARLGRYHDHVDVAFRGWHDSWTAPGFRAWDIRPRLAALTVPAIVVQGRSDPYGTVEQARFVVDSTGGPTDAVVLAECGHSPHVDRPAETLAAVSSLVGRVNR